MRAAIIEDGIVVNVIEVDGENPIWVLCPDEVDIGWLYADEAFTAPPQPEPEPPLSPEEGGPPA